MFSAPFRPVNNSFQISNKRTSTFLSDFLKWAPCYMQLKHTVLLGLLYVWCRHVQSLGYVSKHRSAASHVYDGTKRLSHRCACYKHPLAVDGQMPERSAPPIAQQLHGHTRSIPASLLWRPIMIVIMKSLHDRDTQAFRVSLARVCTRITQSHVILTNTSPSSLEYLSKLLARHGAVLFQFL